MNISTKHFIIIFILSLYGCGTVPTAEPGKPIDNFFVDFEDGTLNDFYFLVADSAVNTTIVSHPVRNGRFALKNLLRPDDYTNNGYRAELAIYNSAHYKTDAFYEFSFMIDSNYSDMEYNLLCQWQDLPYYTQGEDWSSSPKLCTASPPLALVYVEGGLEIKMNEHACSNNYVFLVGKAEPISKNKWYDVVAHIYWNDDETAYQEIWLNGKPITPFNGTDNKYYNRNIFSRDGNYFKFGQYRGKDKTKSTNVVYFDDIKVYN